MDTVPKYVSPCEKRCSRRGTNALHVVPFQPHSLCTERIQVWRGDHVQVVAIHLGVVRDVGKAVVIGQEEDQVGFRRCCCCCCCFCCCSQSCTSQQEQNDHAASGRQRKDGHRPHFHSDRIYLKFCVAGLGTCLCARTGRNLGVEVDWRQSTSFEFETNGRSRLDEGRWTRQRHVDGPSKQCSQGKPCKVDQTAFCAANSTQACAWWPWRRCDGAPRPR